MDNKLVQGMDEKRENLKKKMKVTIKVLGKFHANRFIFSSSPTIPIVSEQKIVPAVYLGFTVIYWLYGLYLYNK